MEFEMPQNESSIIKVFGVGGGGSNAVNHMYEQGIKDVDFYVCNTDQQALDESPVPNKIQLGMSLTHGRGAGSKAEVGRDAVLENIEEIKEVLNNNTKMLFITAGMGGGTGTGAAPIIAKLAKEMGILTVAIVTYPFAFEGKRRARQAQEGLETLRDSVDTLLVINNDRLREVYGNLSLKDAFANADDILTTGAKGIAEIITVSGYINIDFEDVRTVLTDSGVAIMGSAKASGENRAIESVQTALTSPLLNDNNIEGARDILLYIASSEEHAITMDEIAEITDYIQDEAGLSADVIWGTGTDEQLGENVAVTIIATGFNSKKEVEGINIKEKVKEKVVHELRPDLESNLTQTPMITAPTNEVATPEGWELKTVEPKIQIDQEKPLSTPVQQNLFEESDECEAEEVTNNNDIEVSAEECDLVETNANVEETNVTGEAISTTQFELEDEATSEVLEEFIVSETETTTSVNEVPKKVVYDLYSDDLEKDQQETTANQQTELQTIQATPQVETEATPFNRALTEEEKLRKSQERVGLIKQLVNKKLARPSNIDELEKEPAFIRRKVNLTRVNHSSENQVSRYNLDSDSDLRTNNSFLHDNVD